MTFLTAAGMNWVTASINTCPLMRTSQGAASIVNHSRMYSTTEIVKAGGINPTMRIVTSTTIITKLRKIRIPASTAIPFRMALYPLKMLCTDQLLPGSD